MNNIVLYIIGILGSATFSVIASGYFNRKKTKADSDSTFADTYLRVNKKLSEDAEKLTVKFEQQIREIVNGYEFKLKNIVDNYEDRLVEKDLIINQQNTIITEQQGVIDTLKHQIAESVEQARQSIHQTVDRVADTLNPEID